MSSDEPVPIEELLSHAGWARRLARALVRDDSAADDLVQRAYAKAVLAPPRRGGSIRGWLAAVIRSLARDEWRSQQRRAAREAAQTRAAAYPSAEEIAARSSAQERLAAAVNRLHAIHRDVIVLRYYFDLRPRHIATRLGIPLTTAKSRLRRAHEELRALLAAEGVRERGDLALVLLPLLPSAGDGLLAGTTGDGAARRRMPTATAPIMAALLAAVLLAVTVFGAGRPAGRSSADTRLDGAEDRGSGVPAERGLGAAEVRRRVSDEPTEAHDAADRVSPRSSAAGSGESAGAGLLGDPSIRLAIDPPPPPGLRSIEWRVVRMRTPPDDGSWTTAEIGGDGAFVAFGTISLGQTADDPGDPVIAIELRADHPRLERSPVRLARAHRSGAPARLTFPAAIPVRGRVAEPRAEAAGTADRVNTVGSLDTTASDGGTAASRAEVAPIAVYAFTIRSGFQSVLAERVIASPGGEFELRLPPDAIYHVVAHRPGLAPAHAEVAVRSEALELPLLPLAAGHTLTVRAEPSFESPWGAAVELQSVVSGPRFQLDGGVEAGLDGEDIAIVGLRQTLGEARVVTLAGLADREYEVAVAASDRVGPPSFRRVRPGDGGAVLPLPAEPVEIDARGLPDGTVLTCTMDGVPRVGSADVLGGRARIYVEGEGRLTIACRLPDGRRWTAVRDAADSRSLITGAFALNSPGEIVVTPPAAPSHVAMELLIELRALSRAQVGLPGASFRAKTVRTPLRFHHGLTGEIECLLLGADEGPPERSYFLPTRRRFRADEPPTDLPASSELGGRLVLDVRDRAGRPVPATVSLERDGESVPVWLETRSGRVPTLQPETLCPLGVTHVREALWAGTYRVRVRARSGAAAAAVVDVTPGQTTVLELRID